MIRPSIATMLGLAACGSGGPPPVGPEIDTQVTINEVMADNALTVVTDAGAAGDWVELYNPTDSDIPLSGYGLTDDLARTGRAVIGDAVLPAGGHLVVTLADIDLDLAREGGELGFSRADGSYIDQLVYGAQEVDFSAAREPDGSGAWVIEWHASPGEANPAGDGAAPGADPEEVPAAGDLSERILAYDVMPEVELRFTAEAAEALESQPRIYVQAELVFDGRVYGPVGLRLKGMNSFLPLSQKASFRINVDEFSPGAKFFGLDDLTFNNMSSDRSMLRERLAYRVAREAGVPSSRANHALISVNGEFYGLYTNVETVKWRLVGRWFADPGGSLWEGVVADFIPGGTWELESGPDDHQLIDGAIDALALPNPTKAITEASRYISMPAFLRFWAMCAVVGQFDSLPTFDDDYFLYADPDSDRLHFLPWGMDESMLSSAYDPLQTRSVLANQCQASPACLQDFADQAWEVLALSETLDLDAERARVAEQIADAVARDQRKPYTDAQVAAGQNDVHWFIAERRMRFTEMLPPPSP